MLTMTMTLPTTQQFKDQADLLGAVGDPVRLQILWHLCQGELNVTDLCRAIGKRQQAISHHLTILKLRGLVARDRRGKSNFYTPTGRGRDALLRNWA